MPAPQRAGTVPLPLTPFGRAVTAANDVGWFLDSGRGVAVVFAILAATAAVDVILSGRRLAPVLLRSLALAGGAVVAMTLTFASIGFSSIFPIVLFVGAMVIASAVALGGVVGYGLRHGG